jgi:hypothetical protein
MTARAFGGCGDGCESSDRSHEVRMKSIAVLIDGTWGKEGTGLDTNVAKLDSGKKLSPKPS